MQDFFPGGTSKWIPVMQLAVYSRERHILHNTIITAQTHKSGKIKEESWQLYRKTVKQNLNILDRSK